MKLTEHTVKHRWQILSHFSSLWTPLSPVPIVPIHFRGVSTHAPGERGQSKTHTELQSQHRGPIFLPPSQPHVHKWAHACARQGSSTGTPALKTADAEAESHGTRSSNTCFKGRWPGTPGSNVQGETYGQSRVSQKTQVEKQPGQRSSTSKAPWREASRKRQQKRQSAPPRAAPGQEGVSRARLWGLVAARAEQEGRGTWSTAGTRCLRPSISQQQL